MECDGNYTEKLLNIDGWCKTSDNRGAVEKTFTFKNFKLAFSFITIVALKSEQMNHHPEWENIYNKVKITLFTHDKGSITHLDYELSSFIEESYKNFLI